MTDSQPADEPLAGTEFVVRLAERAEPGSTFVVRCPDDLTEQAVTAVADALRDALPDINLVMLASGVDLAAVCPPAADSTSRRRDTGESADSARSIPEGRS